MLDYVFDIEKDSNYDIYAKIFPAPFLKTGKKKCVATTRKIYSWIKDDSMHDLTSFHQYILYWIIEFCSDEETAYQENCIELNITGEEARLFTDLDFGNAQNDSLGILKPF